MPHLTDVAHIFRERDNVTLRRRVVENERQIMEREALLVRLVSDGYLRAVLSLIESEKSHGFHSELTTGQSQSEHYVVLIVSLHWTVGDSAVKAAFRIRKELVPN